MIDYQVPQYSREGIIDITASLTVYMCIQHKTCMCMDMGAEVQYCKILTQVQCILGLLGKGIKGSLANEIYYPHNHYCCTITYIR